MTADGHVGGTELPARSRGVLALAPQLCTSCMACVRECPNWCIRLEAHPQIEPAGTSRGRARTLLVLDRFAIDFGSCMYCGLCVQMCPFDALRWSREYAYAATDLEGLVHERDRLVSWAPAVPPPPALDPSAADFANGNTGSSQRR